MRDSVAYKGADVLDGFFATNAVKVKVKVKLSP
jgi:hypothetical protein